MKPRSAILVVALGSAVVFVGCGGGGGGRFKGLGDCTSAAKREAAIKSVEQVPDRLGHIVRRIVLARSVAIGGKASPEDLVACVADAYRLDEERLYASYRTALQDWASRTAQDLSSALTAGHGTVRDVVKELSADVRAAGRDLGYMGSILSEAGKVAGADEDKIDELLQRSKTCPSAMLFVTFRNDPTISPRLIADAEPGSPHPKALEGQGTEIFPRSNEECATAARKLNDEYILKAESFGLWGLVRVVTDDVVEDYEWLYRTEILARIRPRD
jgi:hypothetical protein